MKQVTAAAVYTGTGCKNDVVLHRMAYSYLTTATTSRGLSVSKPPVTRTHSKSYTQELPGSYEYNAGGAQPDFSATLPQQMSDCFSRATLTTAVRAIQQAQHTTCLTFSYPNSQEKELKTPSGIKIKRSITRRHSRRGTNLSSNS